MCVSKEKGVVCIEGRRQMRPIFARVVFSYFHFCESGWQYGGRQRRNKCKTGGANESSVTNLRCEDGNVVELSLFNEITRPFSTNEAHLGCSRPSSERHKISPSYFDYIDKTDKSPNLKLKIIFLAPKHRSGDGGVTFFFVVFFSFLKGTEEMAKMTKQSIKWSWLWKQETHGAPTNKQWRSVAGFKCSCWWWNNDVQLLNEACGSDGLIRWRAKGVEGGGAHWGPLLDRWWLVLTLLTSVWWFCKFIPQEGWWF